MTNLYIPTSDEAHEQLTMLALEDCRHQIILSQIIEWPKHLLLYFSGLIWHWIEQDCEMPCPGSALLEDSHQEIHIEYGIEYTIEEEEAQIVTLPPYDPKNPFPKPENMV